MTGGWFMIVLPTKSISLPGDWNSSGCIERHHKWFALAGRMPQRNGHARGPVDHGTMAVPNRFPGSPGSSNPQEIRVRETLFFRNWLQRSQLEFESQVAGWDDFSGAGSHSCRPRAQFTPVSEFMAHQIKWSLRHPPTKLKLGTQKFVYDILWLRMR